jgi:hypothetical protein
MAAMAQRATSKTVNLRAPVHAFNVARPRRSTVLRSRAIAAMRRWADDRAEAEGPSLAVVNATRLQARP